MRPTSEDGQARRGWLDAGVALLVEGGVGAVKVRPLAEHAGLTTGSFYHHFDGLKPYLDELAAHCAHIDLPSAVDGSAEPVAALVDLAVWLHSAPMRARDTALRRWATHDERASVALAQRDGRILEAMADLFAGAGLYQRRSRVCAHLLYATVVADLRSDDQPTDDDVAALVRAFARVDGA